MRETRHLLHRLGWPTERLSDKEIASELRRRWLEGCPGQTADDSGPATAEDVVSEMATAGNLDALCWPMDNGSTATAALGAVKDNSGEHGGCGSIPYGVTEPDRRRSSRGPTRDRIDFTIPSLARSASGWLVDASENGIAFIVMTPHTPPIGTHIHSCLRRRKGMTPEPRIATIVRTETLNECLTLVCAQLGELGDPLP
ncbi:MAG: PilZ domain-containing protein [Planctomycetes bacterium]|nr:PilZ domain-containing protein [Planctomycetota bacterium]